jgi:NTE family protein
MAPPPDRPSLENVGIFRGLSAADLAAMEAELETMALKRGDTLVRQGDAADALYIVVSGRFEVRLRGRDGVVAELGPASPAANAPRPSSPPATASCSASAAPSSTACAAVHPRSGRR